MTPPLLVVDHDEFDEPESITEDFELALSLSECSCSDVEEVAELADLADSSAGPAGHPEPLATSAIDRLSSESNDNGHAAEDDVESPEFGKYLDGIFNSTCFQYRKTMKKNEKM